MRNGQYVTFKDKVSRKELRKTEKVKEVLKKHNPDSVTDTIDRKNKTRFYYKVSIHFLQVFGYQRM